MISAGDFKNGLTLEIDGNVVQIMEFQHVKPGKGAAFVRTKLKMLSVAELLKKHSDQLKNSHRHVLSVWICSIYTMMVICITS
jgi:efp: translation elongation factor P